MISLRQVLLLFHFPASRGLFSVVFAELIGVRKRDRQFSEYNGKEVSASRESFYQSLPVRHLSQQKSNVYCTELNPVLGVLKLKYCYPFYAPQEPILCGDK